MNDRNRYLSFLTIIVVAILVIEAATQVAQGDPPTASVAPIRIAITGDSTVADYQRDDAHRGWGQLFPEFVDTKQVLVKNFAANGRSTKTFQREGRWDKALASKPSYIFIQFGHNDSHSKGHPEATDADTDYSGYLREFIESARAQGAIPILVTPMHRGLWDAEGSHLSRELLPYAEAMRRVAAEKKVPLVDLYSLSGAAFEKIGKDHLGTLFAFPAKDETHFNEKGARLLAGMVAAETARLVPALKPYLKLPPQTASQEPSPAVLAQRFGAASCQEYLSGMECRPRGEKWNFGK